MDDGDIRVGSAEREQALAALAEHHAAGRLDANDYEDRRGRATDAVVRRDLTELFVDLPEPRPHPDKAALSGPSAGVVQSAPPVSARGRTARALVGLSPFIAVALFLWTGRWWWFLLIPALAVIAKNLDD
ncbi:DUF1707 domain-containing protein [Terrabacter sp. C0L_2]|uniref:DUF1707 domain-containing protein n=1 Tax=Terrabacter sp. C0L_2 TaxID=3108389 RepID=UPI002ED25172|nr:DUF1707 domain-containing protein [Terrabacter sp. C0L_2]